MRCRDHIESTDRLVDSVIYKRPFGKAALLDTEIWKNNPDAWDATRLKAGELVGQAYPPQRLR